MVEFMVNNTQLFLIIFFSVLGFFLALAVLAHLRTLALIRSGLYRPGEHSWFDGHHFRDGLWMLALGGGLFAGIYFHLGFWSTIFLTLGAMGVASVANSFIRS
ncbi:MAG: hypothetical protein ACYC9Q_02375 [Bacillota bacterium]